MNEARGRLRGLYAITPEGLDTGTLLARVEQSLAGGASLVQYRAKSVAPGVALEQARAISKACRSHGALFIVNDSVELAAASQAHGVHLGREDADPRAARAAMPSAIIGVSCYADASLAARAARTGADYVAVGSVFPSATKPGAQRAALACIGAAREASGLPVAAIGGITPGNAPQAIAAGADMVAVISALFESPDIAATARAFARSFESGSQVHGEPQRRAV
ncbi:MAG TPA: thiamine phosphate synthase [Usitatibacter sp.]|nr:thiamine phosphate synthase [Usitatibacter sp.]